MKKRECIELQRSETVALYRSPKEQAPEEWMITGLEGKGGGTLCYRAVCGGVHGRLKEFYPLDPFSDWTQTESGLLYLRQPEDWQAFCALREEYLEPYHILTQTRDSHPRAALLNNYLPAAQILYGRP